MRRARMDNLTHTLVGIALSRAGGSRLGPYATGLLVLACNAPDIDVVARLGSGATFLANHRGITHALLVAPLLAVTVAGLFLGGHKLARASGRFRFAPAFLTALGGILFGHLFLDWTTNYGTRLLLPFSGRWLASDAVPIIDGWLLLVLAASLTLPLLFRLISEEIGAHRAGGRGAAIFALVFLLVWFGFRGLCHARAVAVLESRTYHGLEPRRVGAFASLANPFHWHGVVETAEAWEVAEVELLEEFDPTRTRTYHPPDPSTALEAARRTRTARIFLDFARFPYSYVEVAEDGYEVVLRDLRFEFGVNGQKGFVARIRLNRGLALIEEDFRFRPTKPVR